MRVIAKSVTLLILLAGILNACQQGKKKEDEGKEKELSQEEKIVKEMQEAMGGNDGYEEARAFRWVFFGQRKLYWNKKTGDVRIDMIHAPTKILMNINSMEGKVFLDGKELTDKDSLENFLSIGKKIWVNDSYWLFMPFKLDDPGVSLEYLGEDTTQYGDKADVLEATFDQGVGETPANKYHIYVDKDSRLVTQWSFYNKEDQKDPSMVTTWGDYRRYGPVLLARKRGKEVISEIAVYDSLPPVLFEEPDTVDVSRFEVR